jgi:hypothetical protein
MFSRLRLVATFALIVAILASCSKEPNHQKLIPKDAAVVAGINVKSLSKTIAWNVITGSKLFKEMQKRMPEKANNDLAGGIGKFGIDPLNTFYVYLKTDARFTSGIRVTGLIPLSSSTDWEAFLQKTFPTAKVTESNGIKKANLDGNLFIGWNSDLLILMNSLDFSAGTIHAGVSPDMASELENAFKTPQENSITSNKNFTSLENAGHDFSLWINYEQIMNQYVAEGKMTAVTVNPDMWKNAAMACGFDFKKGQITGDLSWYSSKDMDSIYRQFGANNVDKDLVKMIPGENLDMMFAWHLSTKGIKSVLEKTQVLGLVNIGLSTTGLDADQMLDAFTGDMAFTMNDLTVSNVSSPDGTSQMGKASMSYIMKIKNAENFNKILDVAKQTGQMAPLANGYFVPVSLTDTLFILLNSQYLVTSNHYDVAANILQQKGGKPLKPETEQLVKSHPFSLHFDIAEASRRIEVNPDISPADRE